MIHQGLNDKGRLPERVLLLGYYDRFGISTVMETIEAIQRFSAFPVTVLNMYEHRYGDGYLRLHPSFRFDAFDAVIVHNSVAYDVSNVSGLDEGLAVKLSQFEGAKILLKQDENHRAREMARYIGDTVFDVVYSCLPAEETHKVYPPDVVGPVRIKRMLTGYVTQALRNEWARTGSRTVDIGYRGSIQPLSFGRLAYEKRKIGDDVARLLERSGLILDISSRWEDRFGGDAWFTFLRSCKATLGVESGASIFDVDGKLEQACASAREALGPERDEPDYAEAFLEFLKPFEGAIYYNQISPRHFEAAATGTVQLMYPGRYSDIFFPNKHYFPLERDYSNLTAAIELVRDSRARERMARCAYEEIVLNPQFSIESFVADIDAEIERVIEGRGIRRSKLCSSGKGVRNALLMCAHEPVIDPRIGWVAKYATPGIAIQQLGVVPQECPASVGTAEWGGLIIRSPKQRPSAETLRGWYQAAEGTAAGVAGLAEIKFMFDASVLDDLALAELVGGPPGSDRLVQFRWYLAHVLQVSNALITAVLSMRGVSALIATDLDTLPAAVALKGILGVPLIYDSHEYWPESDVRCGEFETQFWMRMESRLVRLADRCHTVSSSLAEFMAGRYGVPFTSVPNAEPLAEVTVPLTVDRLGREETHFLFLGNFAPRRGLELLVDAWKDTQPSALLFLQGPENEYKDSIVALAEETGLLGTRIFFPPAVRESELVATAARADVGLIPYTPAGIGYQNCCPNKLSQYMAAGIPILANSTNFVKHVLSESGAGVCIDFTNRRALVAAVNSMVSDPGGRQQQGRAAREYFVDQFHWEVCSEPLYRGLRELIATSSVQPFDIYDGLPPTPGAARSMYSAQLSAAVFPDGRGGEKTLVAESVQWVADGLARACNNLISDLTSQAPAAPSSNNAGEAFVDADSAPTSGPPNALGTMASRFVFRGGSAIWHRLPGSVRARLLPAASWIAGRLAGAVPTRGTQDSAGK